MPQSPESSRLGHEALRDWLRFFRAESHILRESPHLLFQQAANESDSTAPAQAARRPGSGNRPWLRWINKSNRPGSSIVTMVGHWRGVIEARFCANGRRLASLGLDGTVRVWDTDVGIQLAEHPCDESRRAWTISDDGRLLATVTWDGTLTVWDLDTEVELLRIGDLSPWCSCHFLLDSETLLIIDPLTVRLWSIHTRREVAAFVAGRVLGVAPDLGRLICNTDGKLLVLDTRTGTLLSTLEPTSFEIDGALFFPDALYIVGYGSRPGRLAIWDASTGTVLASVPAHPDRIGTIAISPTGTRLVSASYDGSLTLWSFPELRAVSEHKGAALHCCFSPSGQWLLSASTEGACLLFDAATGRDLGPIGRPGQAVTSCGFHPDGRCIFTASADSNIRLWETPSPERPPEQARHLAQITTLQPTSDHQRFVSASVDGTVRLWDPATGEILREFSTSTSAIRDCAVSPDGEWIASASDDTDVRVWPLNATGPQRVLRGHSQAVRSCHFSPSGDLLASADHAGVVIVWDVLSGACVAMVSCSRKPIDQVRFLKNGRWVAWQTVDAIGLVDSRADHPAPVTGRILCVSPDGGGLVFADGVDAASLYDVESSTVKKRLAVSDGRLVHAIISLHNRYLGLLLAQGSRTVLRIWDLHVEGNHQGQLISSAEWDLGNWEFSPGEDYVLAAGSSDRDIILWETQTGRLVAMLRLPRQPAERKISLWDHAEGGHQLMPASWRWSPTDHWLATASGGNRIIIWDPAGQALADFRPPSAVITGLRWTGDGSILVASEASGGLLFLRPENLNWGPPIAPHLEGVPTLTANNPENK